MNCKPGDLARIIAHPDTIYFGIVDRIIRVRELRYVDDGSVAAWTYDPPVIISPRVFAIDPSVAAANFVPDKYLKPIDNPPDNAVDESARWLPPVPQTEKESDHATA